MEEIIKYSVTEYAKVARMAVAEGIVMLKNEEGVLPLVSGCKISLFGRSQLNYYKSGTGSGGMVNTAYVTGIKEAFISDSRYMLNEQLLKVYENWSEEHPFVTGKGWAQEPWFQEEMPVSKELAEEARKFSDTAIIIIGRTAGEDKDNLTEEGSYFLTETEEKMLENVCNTFEHTIVLLNVGNIIDMKWVEKYQPSAVLYVWQGGQEGGNGVLDVLSGDVSPSGRLTDTIARDIADYPSTAYYGDDERNFYKEDIYVGYRYFSTFAPEKVIYPFGFGLSYTTFEKSTEVTGNPAESIKVKIQVKNTGKFTGKEIVQIYCQAPQGLLGKPVKALCGFSKTKYLAPGESQMITVDIPAYYLASYDDSGITGNISCYVLEEGNYAFYLGENVRDTEEIAVFNCHKTIVLEQLEEALAPVLSFERMKPGIQRDKDIYEMVWDEVPVRTVDPKQRRMERMPEEYPYTGNKGYKLGDVDSGKVSMKEFIAQLSDEELCCIVRGEGMCSPKVTPGTAGAFGGVTDSLADYGIPIGCCADGPSGIRMDCGTIAFAMPCGTALACTFNTALVEELYEWEGLELRKNQIESLLGPGMNIHRNPLNGRNFEYFSEDPLLTGKMASAQLWGMQKYGVTGTIKHFACNNQEHRRDFVDAVVSERALREIYLKGFEVAVKEGQARSIMSTYGPLNGLWTAGSYDLLTTILRKEWGYRGIVMTDWWAKANDEGEEATIQNVAAMIRAQNDLYMVTGNSLNNANDDNSMEELKNNNVTRGEYQRSAANICCFLLASPAYLRLTGRETELDKELQNCGNQENTAVGKLLKVALESEVVIDDKLIDTMKGKSTTIQVAIKKKGYFRLEFLCRASDETSDLAQLPLSIFHGKYLIETVSLAGTEKEWQRKNIRFMNPLDNYTFFIKLFFGMSGMEIKDVRLAMENNKL